MYNCTSWKKCGGETSDTLRVFGTLANMEAWAQTAGCVLTRRGLSVLLTLLHGRDHYARAFWVHGSARWRQRLSSCLVEEELRGQPVRPRPCLGHTIRKASLLTLTWPTITWQVFQWSAEKVEVKTCWDVLLHLLSKGLIVTMRSSKYTTRHYCQKSVLPWFSFGCKKARARVVEKGNMPVGGQRLSCKEQRRPQNTT